MALGSDHVIGSEVNTAGFVPEVWSDEIIAAYKKNLVAANLIKKMNMKGKKGDVVHFPAPARADATTKAAETQVTLIAETGTEKTVTINQHTQVDFPGNRRWLLKQYTINRQAFLTCLPGDNTTSNKTSCFLHCLIM